jgi:hypothetical protein
MASMITTEDNPYDPRTDFGAWYMWDVGQGYNTSSYLARVASVSEGFPEAVIDRQIEDAIDEIIAMHSGKLYVKLTIEDEERTSEPTADSTPSNSSAA